MEKSTGWKVPLLFCAVVILLVGALQLWRSATAPDVVPLDATLLARADTFRIDLPADDRGRYYQKAITNAATGFQPRTRISQTSTSAKGRCSSPSSRRET